MKTAKGMEQVDHGGEHTNSEAGPLGRVTIPEKCCHKVPALCGPLLLFHPKPLTESVSQRLQALLGPDCFY